MEEKIQEIETNISEEKEEKKMSKKTKFLIGAGVVGGLVTIVGLVVSKIAKNHYIPVEDQEDDVEFVDEDLDSEVEENSDSDEKTE